MIFNREPALILTLVAAVISLAVGFGLDITGEQVSLIMSAVVAVMGVWIRSKVSPVDSDGKVITKP